MIGSIPIPRFLFLLVACFALTFASSSALADGKVFRSALAEPPPIPDQQALICYNPATQVQTLAIETRFQLSATSPKDPAKSAPDSYAWVVPIPGPEAPVITPGTTGLFPTLRVIFQPRVRDMRGPEYAYPVLLAVGVILVLVRMTERGTAMVGVLLSGLLGLLAAMLLLPTLGTAGSTASASATGVDVLDRSIVGDYQVTTIAAAGDAKDSAAALSAWLDANGFKQPPSVAPVLADYARRSWVFACVKLLQLPKPSDDGTLTPHPLVFTFRTPAAVYPMALTGVGNGPLKLDLYVFGSGTAQVPGMKLVRSDAAVPASDSGPHRAWRRSPDVLIAHPELVRCVGKLPIATKLSGTLRPEQQAQDLPITFSDFTQTGSIVYSRDAAVMRGIDVASAALLAGMVLLVVITAFMRQNAAWLYRRLPIIAAIAIVAGFSMWVATPAVKSARLSRTVVYKAKENVDKLREVLPSEIAERHARPTLEDARLAAQRIINREKIRIRDEDSPGNYTITLEENGDISFTSYDAIGSPSKTCVWSAPRSNTADGKVPVSPGEIGGDRVYSGKEPQPPDDLVKRWAVPGDWQAVACREDVIYGLDSSGSISVFDASGHKKKQIRLSIPSDVDMIEARLRLCNLVGDCLPEYVLFSPGKAFVAAFKQDGEVLWCRKTRDWVMDVCSISPHEHDDGSHDQLGVACWKAGLLGLSASGEEIWRSELGIVTAVSAEADRSRRQLAVASMAGSLYHVSDSGEMVRLERAVGFAWLPRIKSESSLTKRTVVVIDPIARHIYGLRKSPHGMWTTQVPDECRGAFMDAAVSNEQPWYGVVLSGHCALVLDCRTGETVSILRAKVKQLAWGTANQRSDAMLALAAEDELCAYGLKWVQAQEGVIGSK